MQLTDKDLRESVVREGLVTEEQLVEVDELVNSTDISLYDALLEKRVVTDEKIGDLIARTTQTPFVDLATINIPDGLLHIVPERVAKKKRCLVFDRTQDSIKIAMENPQDQQTIDLIRAKTGTTVVVYYATPRSINRALEVYKIDIKKTLEDFSDEDLADENNEDE